MFITTKEAPQHLIEVMKARLVPMLVSSPGCGKSSIADQIADKYKLKLIDVRLAQCDPTDLSGLPSLNADRTKAHYLPMDTFPLETDEIPEGYKGWLLLFDEMNSAPMSVQAAAYKVILDRKIGQVPLHEKVWVMAAGNLATDKAIVNRLSTAMQSRMIHFQMEVIPKDWLEWFETNGGDYRISAYIKFKPENLHVFDPNHSDKTFACPRTWSFLSAMSKNWKDIDHKYMAIIIGTLGEAVGREFVAFCKSNFTTTIEEILAQPKTLKISDEPSTLYALSSLVSHHANKGNIGTLMEFIDRLPVEFQVITIKAACARSGDIRSSQELQSWIKANAIELMA